MSLPKLPLVVQSDTNNDFGDTLEGDFDILKSADADYDIPALDSDSLIDVGDRRLFLLPGDLVELS
jgi:hypothetical protein